MLTRSLHGQLSKQWMPAAPSRFLHETTASTLITCNIWLLLHAPSKAVATALLAWEDASMPPCLVVPQTYDS